MRSRRRRMLTFHFDLYSVCPVEERFLWDRGSAELVLWETSGRRALGAVTARSCSRVCCFEKRSQHCTIFKLLKATLKQWSKRVQYLALSWRYTFFFGDNKYDRGEAQSRGLRSQREDQYSKHMADKRTEQYVFRSSGGAAYCCVH